MVSVTGGVSKKNALNGADFKTFRKADMKFESPVAIRFRTVMNGIRSMDWRATNLKPPATTSSSKVNGLALLSTISDFDMEGSWLVFAWSILSEVVVGKFGPEETLKSKVRLV